MGAKRPDPACQPAYDAADLWIDRALRADNSLFTEGVPIWSKGNLGEARALFVGNADSLKGKDFLGRLGRVMKRSGSPPALYQLMGEAAYVAYLIIYKDVIGQDKKIENINRILRWSSKPVEIPDCLRDGLANGIMSPGEFVDFRRRLKTVILIAERWKTSGSDGMLVRDDPKAPWCFQEFLAGIDCLTDALQVPPLHLVHPDTFEPLVWSNKVKVAEAPKLHDYVSDELAEEVNRRIRQIRVALEPEFGCCFHFIDCLEVCRMWSDKCKDENEPADC